MIRGLKFLKDYRRFRKLGADERRIVFYSESGQDWHHVEPVIKELTERRGCSVCYVSSDPDDPGLASGDPLTKGFCVGDGLLCILFFQFLKADIVILTMLDLDNFHLKRSVHPVHYVFMFHSLVSAHMADFENSYDHYDTILCAGPHQMREILRREEIAGVKPKHLVPHGYHRLEQLYNQRQRAVAHAPSETPHVLLAPSWGEQTILNTCGERLIEVLLNAGFLVTLRPHYQTRLKTPDVIDRILSRFTNDKHFRFVDRMAEDNSLFDSDIMITDWSGAGMDYGLGLEKPVLYIDLPPKSRNDAWPGLGIEPFEVFVRTKIGDLLSPDRLSEAPAIIRCLLADPQKFRSDLQQLRQDSVYNFGNSSEAAADAILNLLSHHTAGGTAG